MLHANMRRVRFALLALLVACGSRDAPPPPPPPRAPVAPALAPPSVADAAVPVALDAAPSIDVAACARGDCAAVERACAADAIDDATEKHGAFCHLLYLRRGKDPALLAKACAQGYRLDCPCKTDADCPEDADRQGYVCYRGACALLSSD